MEASVVTPSTSTGERPEAAAVHNPRLLVLDGLRGVAAFGVINDHADSVILRMLTPGRYLAVDFFWVLSGFVLALAYDERLKGRMSALEFMRIRLIRFYPLYLVGLFLGFIAMAYPIAHHWGHWTPYYLMLALAFGLLFLPFPPFFQAPELTSFELFPLNGPSYTLFYELVVNAIYGIVARFLSIPILVAIAGISALAVFLIVPHYPPGSGWLWSGVAAGAARVVYCFFTGVLIHFFRKQVRMPAIPAWLALAVYLAFICIPAPEASRAYYEIAVILVGMPVLVAFAAGASVTGVGARVFGILGMLSYGVYVTHGPIVAIYNYAAMHVKFHIPGVVMVLLASITAATLAWVADSRYDAPFRRWLTARIPFSKSGASDPKAG